MKNKIIYICITSATLILCLFFQAEEIRFLLAYEIILIPLLILLLIVQRRKLKARIVIPYYHTQKNSEFKIEAHIRNVSVLPMPSVLVKLKCVNEFTGRQYRMEDRVMIDGRDEVVLEFYLKSGCCGKFSVNIEQIRIYDYLKLFGMGVRPDKVSDEIMVLPVFHRIYIDGGAMSKNRHEWEQYSHTNSGEDTSEVFDVHAYRPGDTFQRVHWKLTAKTNEFLVKEYSMPIENMVVMFLNLCSDSRQEYTQEKLDCFLEILSSLSWSMMEQGIHHMVIWYDTMGDKLETASIESEKDVYSMLEQVCNGKLYEDDVDVRRLYCSRYEQLRIDNSLLLDVEGRFFRDEICLKQFNYDDLEKELIEWKLEI